MRDVYWEVEAPFAVSRVLGVAPIDAQFVMRLPQIGWTLFTLGFTVALGTYLTLFMEAANTMFQMSPFSLILERAQLLIILLTVLTSAGKSVANVRTLHSVMRRLHSLDAQLLQIGVPVPYSRLYGCVIASIRLLLNVSLCFKDLIVFKSFKSYKTLIVQYILIMPLLVSTIVQVQFMVLLELVQRRIRILIGKLEDVARGDGFVRRHHLHVLVSVHSSLLTICEVVNSLYSLQILINLSSVFINTTSNLYHVIDKTITYITMAKAADLNFVTLTTYRVVVRSFEVWTMVTTCVNTQALAKEFTSRLYQVMVENRANEISRNKKLRLHIAMNRQVVFTACGFFTLDYTLVHSMIAAATTYLVILIQFGQPNSPPENSKPSNDTM